MNFVIAGDIYGREVHKRIGMINKEMCKPANYI